MEQFLNKLKSSRHKNNKPLYYLKSYFRVYLGSKYNPQKAKRILNRMDKYDSAYIMDRVNYYNKLDRTTPLSPNTPTLKEFVFPEDLKTYFFDALPFTRLFHPDYKFRLLRGDITEIPEEPAIVKSRPINGDNQNSVLLKLNYIRHFITIKSDKKFKDKMDKLVWRGNILAHQDLRAGFFENHFGNPLCNIGYVNNIDLNPEWKKDKLTFEEQLQYKFILSLEGNDVATNLKWVMSSNSIAVMPTPKYETWFMEGRLIPDFHYIHIKDDFSNLNEKLEYYIQNPEKAQEIIKNAHTYVSQFNNTKREELLSVLVLKKYFELTQ